MAKKENVENEVLVEIKRLSGLVGELLSNGNYDEAWTNVGALNALYKEHKDSLNPAIKELLSGYINKYYYHNKKFNSATYGLKKIGEGLSETASMIKIEK